MDDQAQSEALVSAFAVGVPIFLLIDPLVGEPIAMESSSGPSNLEEVVAARESAWQRTVFPVLLDSQIELPPALQPYCVALQGPHDPWINVTLELAQGELSQSQAEGLAGTGSAQHWIGGWLQSSLIEADLTDQLSALMRVNTEAYTPLRYQRLADRRVLAWLGNVAGATRLQAMLGGIQRWIYLDACGQLTTLVGGDGGDFRPIRLTAAEWKLFMTGEVVHPTIARWLGELQLERNECKPSTAPAHEVYRRAQAALEHADVAARRWPQRFEKTADWVAWAALILMHPQFEREPEIVAILDAPAAPDAPIETLNSLCPLLRSMLKRNDHA